MPVSYNPSIQPQPNSGASLVGFVVAGATTLHEVHATPFVHFLQPDKQGLHCILSL